MERNVTKASQAGVVLAYVVRQICIRMESCRALELRFNARNIDPAPLYKK